MTSIPVESSLTSTQYSRIQRGIDTGANLLFLSGSLLFILVFWLRSLQQRRLSRSSNKLASFVTILLIVACLSGASSLRSFLLHGLPWLLAAIITKFFLVRSSLILLCCWGTFQLFNSALAPMFNPSEPLWWLPLPASLALVIFSATELRQRYSSHSSVENSAKEPLLGTGEDADSLFDQAGTLGLALFTWLDPLLAMGHKKLLHKSDVPGLAKRDRVKTVSAEFFQALELQKQHQSPPSIFRTLVACHYKAVLVTGLFAFMKAVITSLNPLLLQLFIDFSAGTRHFPQEGYVLVAVLFLSKLVENLSQRQWSFGARRLGLRVRSSLIAAIYEKELKLSHDARQRHSAGEITSYISVDTFRLGEFPWWLHQSWTYPLQIFIALCILVHTVGWATLPGLVIILVTAAIQTPVAKAQQRYQYSLMLAQDERLRTTSAIIGNMKIVKLQAWEKVFKDLIWSSRSVEFKWLSAVKNIMAYGSLTYWMSPIITASIVFAACIPLGVKLNATLVFTVLATFRVIQEPIRNVPEVLTAIIQAGVSMGRLSRFFNDNELQVGAADFKPLTGSSEELAVLVDDADFGWNSSDKPALSNISLKVRQSEVVAICGMVGSGKSTLLHSVLGETRKLKGKVEVRGSIAYVAQSAWIQSGTVRDNVLFGQAFEESRYRETLLACSLVEDLSSFAQGDLTEIGERGLNLSGGQKQRIQLARALYSNADIYLLDDPFSALDAQTASSLFKAYVLKALSEKTVILVTHQVEFLSAVDKILVMNGGQILQAGSYQELLHPGSMFEQLVNAHQDAGGQKHYKHNSGEDMPRISSFKRTEAPTAGSQGFGQLTQEEERETGNLGLKPYKDYVKISRTEYLAALAILVQGLFVFGTSWSNYWLASQVSNPATSDIKLVGVYAAISFLSAVFVQARSRSMMSLGLRACQAYFSGLLESLFQAPMFVFDSTPLGRILSRLSSDMNLLDVDIPTCFAFVLAETFDLIGFLVIISIVTWQILLIALPLLLVLWFLQRYYLNTARELIRINGTTKAPLLNKTAETVNGAVTIRAFKKEEQFKNENMELIDSDGTISIHTCAAYEWLAMRVEVLGAIVISSAALLMVLFQDAVPPGLAGLSLSYALGFNGVQVFLVQWSSNLANYMISAERIAQYMTLPKEAPHIVESNRPPPTWPSRGRVELLNLQIRYRENSPLVLKGISCTFFDGKRIGLVGRTGSGKTTLISALFRLVEPAGGSIVIDGIDISKIGLHDLRSKLGVIPQEAFLFRGTVRFNLDPSEQFSDDELWQALRRCQLSQEIEGSPDGLDSLVTDEGENWSAGQRQLFCLARVLLKRSKVLVLDEATASIDSTTDAVLQRVIREEFSGCTVITVAHRIPTVIDSDMVLSLRDGYLVEYDSPKALLEMKGSLFAKLVNEYWASCKT